MGVPQSVSDLVKQISTTLGGAYAQVTVQGELADVKKSDKGHWYYTLKDSAAQMRGALWKGDAATLTFVPKNGLAVVLTGRVAVYGAQGSMQLVATTIERVGVGSQRLALEALYRRLYAEGVFSHPKRALPVIPRAVGVITSATGAVIHDIEAVAGRRAPGIPVRLYPAQVQGAGAVTSLVAALHHVSSQEVDVVIIGRGGGGAEDLSAFNDEAVVRAIVACPVPVIAAVGHEINKSLTDVAADRYASTPSVGAELVTPDSAELARVCVQQHNRAAQALRRRLDGAASQAAQTRSRAKQSVQRQVATAMAELSRWRQHPIVTQSDRVWAVYAGRAEMARQRAQSALQRITEQRTQSVALMRARAAALNPVAILDRGFGLVFDHGQVVTATGVTPGSALTIRWADGEADVVVQAVRRINDDAQHTEEGLA